MTPGDGMTDSAIQEVGLFNYFWNVMYWRNQVFGDASSNFGDESIHLMINKI